MQKYDCGTLISRGYGNASKKLLQTHELSVYLQTNALTKYSSYQVLNCNMFRYRRATLRESQNKLMQYTYYTVPTAMFKMSNL